MRVMTISVLIILYVITIMTHYPFCYEFYARSENPPSTYT